jgi:hypothetical protein
MTLDFFQWFGGVIFAISFILLIMNMVECKVAGEYVNPALIFKNIFSGFILLVFSRPLVIWSFEFARIVAVDLIACTSEQVTLQQLKKATSSSIWGDIKNFFTSYFQVSSPTMTFITIIMLVVTIVIFFQLLTLYGMYYVQIVTGYFYITDIMRGDQSAITEWAKDVAASGITFMLEYIFYCAGFYIMDINSINSGSLTKCAPGLVLIISSPAIPMALRKWGYNHGSGSARGVVSGLGSAANGAISAISHL